MEEGGGVSKEEEENEQTLQHNYVSNYKQAVVEPLKILLCIIRVLYNHVIQHHLDFYPTSAKTSLKSNAIRFTSCRRLLALS